MDYTNKALGLRVQTQIPLNVKEYTESEESLKNLGINNNLAFTYEKGLIIYCIEEGTRWEWREVQEMDPPGLIPTNFTYPDNIIVHGIDYSNKIYNFFSTMIFIELPPLEIKNEGNGDGIIIRERDPLNYGTIGENAVDLSFSTFAGFINGATGVNSFAEGLNTISSGFAAHSEGNLNLASGTGAHAEGIGNEASTDATHAEGYSNIASNIAAHSEGYNNLSSGLAAHSEGRDGIASGNYSHVGGEGNSATSLSETSIGHYGTEATGSANTVVSTDRIFNVGNGNNSGSRSNAFTLLKNGLATLPSVTNALITAASGKAIVTKEYFAANIPSIPVAPDGSETKITAGTGITKTGTGTTGDPYIISSTEAIDTQYLRGIITQSGTNNPTYIIIKNTTGGTITSAVRDAMGDYTLVFTFNTPVNKTTYRITPTVVNKSNYLSLVGPNGLRIITKSTDGNNAEDDGMLNTPFEILIDP